MKFFKFLIPALAIIIPSMQTFISPEKETANNKTDDDESIEQNGAEEHRTILRRFSDSERFLQFAKHSSHSSHSSHRSHSSHSSGSNTSGDCNGCAFDDDEELIDPNTELNTVALLK